LNLKLEKQNTLPSHVTEIKYDDMIDFISKQGMDLAVLTGHI